MTIVTLHEMDAIFLSYDEVYADFFFAQWKQIFKNIQRVHGVDGLNNAHLAACEMATTDYFVLIDADAFPLKDQFGNNLTFDIPDESIVSNLQSIQGVTKSITPHGGIKIINRKLATAFFETAKNTCVSYELQKGFTVIDSPAMSIEFSNQSADLAFASAYKDAVLFLRATIYPVTYLEKQDLRNLQGKRQRLWVWLTNGGDEPFGFYSMLGAHTAVYDVFTKRVATTKESLEHFKRDKIKTPIINSYDDLMAHILPMYEELEIDMMVPTRPTTIRSNLYERFESLSQTYSTGTMGS